jgi:hypothetical protein
MNAAGGGVPSRRRSGPTLGDRKENLLFTRIFIALLPWLAVALFIVMVAMAVGLGNMFGHGITEWHLP